MTRSYRGLALAAVALLLCAPGYAQQSAIDVKVVNYQQLGEIVTRNKGKVVVVDFWALTCVPCVKEFPHLVALSKKYGKDGVVAISVSVDDPREAGTVQKVQKFLTKHGAAFTNVILDEKPEVWQQKLQTDGVPVVFVFDRERKIYKKYGDNANYVDVEKDVRTLLAPK